MQKEAKERSKKATLKKREAVAAVAKRDAELASKKREDGAAASKKKPDVQPQAASASQSGSKRNISHLLASVDSSSRGQGASGGGGDEADIDSRTAQAAAILEDFVGIASGGSSAKVSRTGSGPAMAAPSDPAAAWHRDSSSVSKMEGGGDGLTRAFLDNLPSVVFRMLKKRGAVDDDANVITAVVLTEEEEDLVGDFRTLRGLERAGVVMKK
jgi:hypothetical protein